VKQEILKKIGRKTKVRKIIIRKKFPPYNSPNPQKAQNTINAENKAQINPRIFNKTCFHI
jgi:hypothetical protein